ncbi:MAG: hypothetical protein ABIY90_19425 [Puia sp.]
MSERFLYKECMHWVSQIQLIRNDLESIKSALRDSEQNAQENSGKSRLISEMLALGTNLDATESLLLASLNNGTTYWAGHSQTYDTPKTELCGNNLFDRMKDIYDTHIELQRAITSFLYNITLDSPVA